MGYPGILPGYPGILMGYPVLLWYPGVAHAPARSHLMNPTNSMFHMNFLLSVLACRVKPIKGHPSCISPISVVVNIWERELHSKMFQNRSIDPSFKFLRNLQNAIVLCTVRSQTDL